MQETTLSQEKIKICCPLCYKNDHDWKEVYSKNNSILGAIDNLYISWCVQESSYVLHEEKETILSN